MPDSDSEPESSAEDQQPEEERRLGEAGEGRLARRAHPLERRAGVQGGRDREEPAQAEQVGEQDEVARRTRRRRRAAERDQQRREQRGHQRRPPARRGTPRSSSC